MKKLISIVLVAAMLITVLPMAVFAEGSSGEIILPTDCFHSRFIYTNNGENHTVTCKDCNTVLRTEAHTFVEGTCVCGAEEVVDYTDPDLTIANTALNMQAYIGAQFIINTAAASKYDSVYVVVTQGEPTGDKEYILDTNISTNDEFIYERKLAAAMMTDTISATVYGVKDGITYTGSTVENWTVKATAVSRLDSYYKYATDKYPQYKAYCKMFADMLCYGAAAQTQFSYATDRLATDGVNANYLALATTTDPTIANTSSTAATGSTEVTVYNTALGIESSVQIQIMFKLPSKASYVNYEVRYSIEGNDYVVDCSKLTNAGSSAYVNLVINEVASPWMRSDVEVTVYNKTTGQPASATFIYNVESLANARLGSALNDLMIALMKFGDSADTYFNHKY